MLGGRVGVGVEVGVGSGGVGVKVWLWRSVGEVWALRYGHSSTGTRVTPQEVGLPGAASTASRRGPAADGLLPTGHRNLQDGAVVWAGVGGEMSASSLTVARPDAVTGAGGT